MGFFPLKPNQTMVPSFPLGKYYTKEQSDAKFAPIGETSSYTIGSIIFAKSDGTLTQDNNNFYIQDSVTSTSNTNVAISFNTRGDFTGSNALNVYSQVDAYLPNSLVGSLATDGATPGFTVSSSRGTGAVPVQSVTGDLIGMFSGWAAQGASSPTYTPVAAAVIYTTGSSTNNLGGEYCIYTKADGGALTLQVTVSNTGLVTMANGATVNGATLTVSGNQSLPAWTTTGAQLAVVGATLNDTTSSGTVAAMGVNAFGISTITATSATTYTVGATVYIAGLPIAGANVTISSNAALYVAAGRSMLLGGVSTSSSNFTSNFNAFAGGGIGAGTSTATVLFGGATTVMARNILNGGTSTVLTTGVAYANTIIGSAPVTGFTSGTHAWFANFVVNPLGTVTPNGSTITNTATLYIGAAGSGGTNNYSLAMVGTTGYYNSVKTTGWGTPAIYGTGRSTAQVGAVGSVATYTVGAADGSFWISANANITAFVAGTFNVTCAYTDETNTAQTLKLNFSSVAGTLGIAIAAVGPFEGIPAHIRVKAGTTITIATSGTFTNLTYNVEGSIIQIS